MNVFIVPSWYPSKQHPSAGIFFKMQAMALAKYVDEVNIGIGTWGSHHEELWIDRKSGILGLLRLFNKPASNSLQLCHNCTEYFDPAFTWSRMFRKGNISEIIKSVQRCYFSFEADYGPIDIIHAHSSYPAGFVAMHISLKTNTPYLITEHMGPFPFPTFIKGKKIDPVVLRPLENASKVLSVSPGLAFNIKKSANVESEVLPNLVDESRFNKKTNEEKTPFRLLFVGRLEKEKGVYTLIRGINEVKKPTILTIVGDGPERENLEKFAASKNYKNIIWEGWKSQDELANIYRKNHALILPSEHENNPLVIIEAFASGIPVIGSNIAGIKELVLEKLGVLFSPGDPTDVARKIEHVVENYKSFDSDYIRAHFLENYSATKVCQKLLTIYRSICR